MLNGLWDSSLSFKNRPHVERFAELVVEQRVCFDTRGGEPLANFVATHMLGPFLVKNH